ncbi:MAG TPA: hypothetical protein VMV15_01180 [Candidatus Binataceae bacterium]|nr:hypothetical protein [Candidatus Binataceae bacterium]
MATKGNCKATDCKRAAFAKSYCRQHYRLWRHGEMPKPRYKICTEEKCRKPRFKGSLCEQHYQASRGAKAAAAAPAAAPPAAAGGEGAASS